MDFECPIKRPVGSWRETSLFGGKKKIFFLIERKRSSFGVAQWQNRASTHYASAGDRKHAASFPGEMMTSMAGVDGQQFQYYRAAIFPALDGPFGRNGLGNMLFDTIWAGPRCSACTKGVRSKPDRRDPGETRRPRALTDTGRGDWPKMLPGLRDGDRHGPASVSPAGPMPRDHDRASSTVTGTLRGALRSGIGNLIRDASRSLVPNRVADLARKETHWRSAQAKRDGRCAAPSGRRGTSSRTK